MVVTMAVPAPDSNFARRHRKALLALTALVVVGVVAALLFDWNWFRPLLEARMSAGLGRKLTIDNLSVELSRTPIVVMDGIKVANPPDFPGDSPMMQIDRTTARFDLKQAIYGTLVLYDVTIDHPVMELERGKTGDPNWKVARV